MFPQQLVAALCSVLLEVHGQLRAEFLAVTRRNISSEYYDLYYCCNVCGGGILWIVDDEDAAIHRMTSSPGDVDFYRYPADPATLRYASVVLSRRVNDNGGQVCLDSVLVVTQTEPLSERRPEVRCTGGPYQQTVIYPDEPRDPVMINNGSVALEHLVDQSNIVAPGSNFTTQILGCRSSGIPQTWEKSERVEAAYNTINSSPGAKVSETYTSNSSIVRVATVLLERQTNGPSDEVYSMFLWTDIVSSSPATVTCVSSNPQEYAYVTVPQPNELNATTYPATQTTTVPHSTVQYNSSTDSSSFGSLVPTLPNSSIDLSFTASALYIKPGKLKTELMMNIAA